MLRERPNVFTYSPANHWWTVVMVLAGGLGIPAVLLLLKSPDDWVLILNTLGAVALFFAVLMLWIVRGARTQRLSFDDDAKALIIENFRCPRHFWDVARKRRVEIPYVDIQWVTHTQHRGSALLGVDTALGRFTVSEHFNDFDDLLWRLVNLASARSTPPAHQQLWYKALYYGVICLIVAAVCIGVVYGTDWLG